MNIEFSYTPIYNSGNNDLVDYNNKKGRRFTDWADDFGMMYPIGDEIPFKLSYKANENGNIGSVNLPIANRPRMKASSSFVYFTSASNEVKQSPTQTTKIKGVKATSITDTSPYVISLIGVYPTPDISSSVKNIVNAYRYGTVYNNSGDFYYNCQFENGRPEGQYSGKVAYAVCKDVFGQVYTVVSESNTKITISRAADMLISADVEEPYAWANPKEDYMLMHAFQEGGVAIENAVELACAYYDKRSTTSASYLYGPITTTYEIPDGTRPVFVQTDDAKFTFVYTDGTKEIIPSDQMVYYYENYDYYASILEVDTALSRGEKRIKELIVEEFKNPWATMAESPMLALEACATYEDGTPVALGSYLCYIGDDVKTDCPKVTGNIIVDNATSLYTKPYDAYLIGYGVTNVSGAYFSKLDDRSLKYSISKDQPKFQATFDLSRTSLGDEDINNITLVCTVADSDLFSITGISKGVNFDRIKFYFSNGDVETYERYQVQSCRLNTDGRTVTKFEIECDSSDFMNQLSEIVYGQFSSKINFKRYKELYGVTDQNVKMLTGNIYVDGNKVFEMDDYYVDIKGVMDDRQAFSVKNPRYIGDKYVPKVLYNNNAQSISIESKLKQSDYAYIAMHIAQNYPKGIYNAVIRIEWTDDDGKNSKHIPVHFSVVGQKTLRYHSNANDETVKGIPSQVSTYESNIQVSDNQPTREGYVFKGWSYSATDKRNLIEAGTAISLAGDVDLYAVWEAKTIVPDNPEGDDPKQPSEDPKNPSEDPKQPVVDPEQQKPTVEPAAPENEEPKPAEIVEASTTEESTSPTKGPKTGDDTPIIWLFILSLLSATGFLIVKHRR